MLVSPPSCFAGPPLAVAHHALSRSHLFSCGGLLSLGDPSPAPNPMASTRMSMRRAAENPKYLSAEDPTRLQIGKKTLDGVPDHLPLPHAPFSHSMDPLRLSGSRGGHRVCCEKDSGKSRGTQIGKNKKTSDSVAAAHTLISHPHLTPSTHPLHAHERLLAPSLSSFSS